MKNSSKKGTGAPVDAGSTAVVAAHPRQERTPQAQPQPVPAPTLVGRTALVTGSSKGLGKAMAMALGEAGACVVLNYKNDQAQAEQTFGEFRDRGFRGALIRADVTDERDVQRLCAESAELVGPIDVLVVNATPPQPQRPIEQYDWATYQQMLDFFVKSPYLLARATLPHMKRQRWGRIINIGSEVFRRGVPNLTAYVAAKGAQVGWSRSLATEVAPWGITVNVVSPGWIPVERHQHDPKELKAAYLALVPMKRWGVPADMGGIVTFLAGDGAGFVTGQDIAVNGGMTVA